MYSIQKSFFLVFISTLISIGQRQILTEKVAVEQALQNNLQMKIADLKIDKQKSLKNAGVNLDNLQVLMDAPVEKRFTISVYQPFQFPTVYAQQYKFQKANINVAAAEKSITTNQLIYNVRTTFNQLTYLIEKYKTLKRQDSIFSDIIGINETRYRVGQISNLEKINGEAYYKQIQFNLMKTMADLLNAKIQLGILLGRPEDTTLWVNGNLKKIIDYEVNQIPDTTFETNPLTNYYNQQQISFTRALKIEKSRQLPGFIVGYYDQVTDGKSAEQPFLYRFNAGITLPIWYWTYGAKINAAKKDFEIVKTQARYTNYQLKGEYSKELANLRNYSNSVTYFETTGNALANEILKSAREGYRLGSIGYYIYLQNLNQAFQIQINALDALVSYNNSLITLQYLLGDQKY
ncbi:MAG: TolC family protein [Bacteroidota bacterium]|nr:TolC family protein [Bacteroidota bacterium]